MIKMFLFPGIGSFGSFSSSPIASATSSSSRVRVRVRVSDLGAGKEVGILSRLCDCKVHEKVKEPESVKG